MQNHVFQIEKLRKITLYGVLLLLILILTLILLFQTSYIQTKITQYITKELSEQLNSKIKIDNVKLSLFRGFVFDGLYIEDQQQDTLLYISHLSAIPKGLQIDISNIAFKEVKLDSAYLNLYSVGKDTLNIKYLLDALADSPSSSSANFIIASKNILIGNSRFSYKFSDSIKNEGIDFNNLNISELNINLENLLLKNDAIVSEIKNISFKEKNGFAINNLSSNKVNINSEKIHLKNFIVQTEESKLDFDSINFDFPPEYDFSNFKTKLKSEISIKKGTFLSYKDVQYFTSDTSNYTGKIKISGNIKGTYDNFNISNLNLSYDDVFSLKLNSEVKNFKDLKDPFILLNIGTLYINIQKLQNETFPYKDKLINYIPKWTEDIKSINYSGITKGKLSKFLTKGKVSGNFGELSIQALAKKDSSSIINIKGDFSGKGLKLASIMKDNNFGEITFWQNFDFSYLKDKKIKLKTSGKINELVYKNHIYKDINLFADMFDNKIDSVNISINQASLNASVIGNVDMSTDIPKINLIADVKNANIFSLNLLDSEHKYSTKFKINANFKGLKLNDFIGTIELTSPLVYKKDTTTVSVNKLLITSKTTNISTQKKVISLESDIVDAEIITYKNPNYTIKRLKKLFNNLLQEESNKLEEIALDTISCGSINIEANIKQADVLMSFFSPDYYISNNTKLYGFYNPEKNNINMSLNSKILKYKDVVVEDFYLISYTKNNKIFGGIGGSSIKPNKIIYAENINLEGEFFSDTINFNLNWNNFKDSANYSANISGKINIKQKENNQKYFDCTLNNSEININDVLWKLNDANIIVDTTKITISDLILQNKKQKIYLDGNISKYPGDILFAEYENFDISNIQPVIQNELVLNGKLSGNTTFAQLYDKPLIFTRDSIVDLNINKINFGTFYFKSNWDNIEDKIHLNAYNLKGKYKKFMNDTIYGDYWPNTGNINFTTEVRSMLLKTFEEYYHEFASFNSTAYTKGKILLYGNYKNPKILGSLRLKQANILIKYLNVNYSIDEMAITFDNTNIAFNKTKIKSSNKLGKGYIKGSISHSFFSDLKLDIDIDAENLQLMNLGRTEESYFYGTAYGTGNVNIWGLTKNIHLDANLKTEKETSIFIPMTSNEALEEEKSFIRFVTDTNVTKLNNKKEEDYKVDLGGFTMNMRIDISPDAEMQIIPDENGYIATNGEGSLNLSLNSEGDFNMFGTYVISRGNYKLNIKSLSKTFKIKEGGKIVWAGDPKGAIVDITAIYSLDNITLNNLIPSQTEETIEKAKVDCSVVLTGTLLDPNLKLGVEFPENVSSEYSNQLSSLDTKSINEQFLSLLLIKRFLTSSGTAFSDAKPVTGDLLTSQLNDMLNKLSSGIGVAVIYNPGQETITDEYGVELSGTILDDRVFLKGGVGIGGNETGEKYENFVGEGEAEIKLNRKGNFRAKFYNKANDRLENDGNYTQGVGLIWRKKFDSFFFWKHKEKKNKKDTAK